MGVAAAPIGTVRRVSAQLAVCITGVLFLGASSALAADHGITAKKLALKAARLVLLSRDANAHVGASAACPAADSSLTLSDGVHTQTFVLPCGKWSDVGSTLAYKDPSAAAGPSQVKIAKRGGGRLKVTGRSPGGFPVPIGAATITALLDVAGTSERYCMRFSGTGDGSAFLVRNAAAGTCPVCGNDVVEVGESCDGSADAQCAGECRADCTCPPPVCGNNVREAGEACDGTDATACAGSCRSDCTCAGPCPDSPGDATACQAFANAPACTACCDDEECLICAQAAGLGCADPASNDHCALTLAIVGCATVCCAP